MTQRTTRPIHVMQIVGDPIGGIRKHVHSVIHGLDRARFVQSYAYSTTAQDEHFRREIGPLQALLLGAVPLRIRKKPHPGDLLNLVKLIYYVKKNKVDVIHGHGAKGGLYARVVGRFCNIKSVYTPHGGMVHNMFAKWEDRLYTAVEKWLSPMTDLYIFESKYTSNSFQNKVVQLPSDRWMVNYNGIPEPNLKEVALRSQDLGYELKNHEVMQVGIFAMLRSQKGQIYAIRAISNLLASGKDKICLHLFGDGPDKLSLRNEVVRLGLERYVIFHGDVSNVEPHMFAMDVILIPSLFESFGYVAIEAMALGKWVISSRVGGLLEVMDEQVGMLVAPRDDVAIADALNECFNKLETLKGHAECCRNRARSEFSVNKMISRIEEAYEEQANKLRNIKK